MTRQQIIARVMACLDEIVPEGEGGTLFDNEPLPIQQYVDTFLDEATKDVLMIAPAHLCPAESADIDVAGTTIKHVEVPVGYIRLISLHCADWEEPITRLIEPSSEPNEYHLAKSVFNRGKARPQAAIRSKAIVAGETTTVKKAIELFNTSEAKATLNYVPMSTAEECNDDLITPVAWSCTVKVLTAAGKEQAKLAQATYEQTIKQLLYVR